MTRTTLEPRTSPRRSVRTAGVLAATIGGLAVLILASTALAPIDYVDHLTVVNPTAYGLNVALGSADGPAVLDLGTVPREAEAALREVADPGSRWVLRISYATMPVGEVAITRSEARGAGWRLEIPTDVGDRLHAEGVAPSSR